MNNQQAKEILVLFRPGTADREDAEFSEALALAKQDPELGQWFREHCAFHEAVRVKFRQIPVPEGLKEQILSERGIRTRTMARQKAVGLVLATAGLAALCVLASLWLTAPGSPSFAFFQDRMARKVLRQYPQMDLTTSDLGQIRQHLEERGRGDYVLPGKLSKTRGTGCALLQFHGRPVTMICFNSGQTGTPNVPDLFLFIVDGAALSKTPQTSVPQFTRISRELSAASWRTANKVYVLAGLGNEDFLRERL
jgi:hypothetical protein